MLQRRILVTGAAGYVGSVLCRQLLAQGHWVRGVDALLFGNKGVEELLDNPNFEFVRGNICKEAVIESALKGVDAVVHLAAIVGDPACKKFPEEATALMDVASRNLFEAAEKKGIQHFVFASTCSNYGQMEGDALLNEDSPLNPQSHYARLKVGFEEYLLGRMPGGKTNITILRFATAYGLSPRMRFDLTVNHFTRDLAVGPGLEVFGQHQWRPYCHVDDLAGSIVLALTLPFAETKGIFNIGDSAENYTKAMIVDEVLKQVPKGKVSYGNANDVDKRNYRVDFSKAQQQLGFRITKRVPDGIREILAEFAPYKITMPFHPIYQNC